MFVCVKYPTMEDISEYSVFFVLSKSNWKEVTYTWDSGMYVHMWTDIPIQSTEDGKMSPFLNLVITV